MSKTQRILNRIGVQLQTNLLFKIGEILLLFATAFALIKLLEPLAEDSPVLRQAIIWVANILMLLFVWAG